MPAAPRLVSALVPGRALLAALKIRELRPSALLPFTEVQRGRGKEERKQIDDGQNRWQAR